MPTWQWGPLTATSSLDSISGTMLDPVFLSGVFDQNDDVNGDNVVCFFLGLCWILSSRELSGTISNIDSICLFNIININDHQGGGRSGG